MNYEPIPRLFGNYNREMLVELHAVRGTDDIGEEVCILIREHELVGIVVGCRQREVAHIAHLNLSSVNSSSSSYGTMSRMTAILP